MSIEIAESVQENGPENSNNVEYAGSADAGPSEPKAADNEGPVHAPETNHDPQKTVPEKEIDAAENQPKDKSVSSGNPEMEVQPQNHLEPEIHPAGETPEVQPEVKEIETKSGAELSQNSNSKDVSDTAADTNAFPSTATPTTSQSATPEPEAPKKPKRLTLQERLALAAKKKKAQKEATTESSSSPIIQEPKENIDEKAQQKEKIGEKTQHAPVTASPDAGGQKIADLEQQLKDLQFKLQEAEKKAIGTAKNPADDRRTELERKLAEKEHMVQQLMDEGEELSKKELKSNEKIKALVASNTKLETSLRNYAEKNSETLLKLGEMEDYLSKHKFKSIEQFMAHVSELKERVSVLESNLAKEQKEEWQRKFKEQEKSHVQEVEQRKDAEKKLSEALLQNELAQNQHKLEVQSKDDIIAGLNSEISSVRGENATELSRLETKIELLRSENENFLKYSSRDAAQETENKAGASFDADYVKLSENHRNLQTQYLSSQENWKSIEMNLLSKIESLSESVQSYQAAKQKNSQEMKRLLNKLSDQDDQITELANENSRLSQASKEAEFQLKMKINEMADLEEKYAEVTSIFNSDRSNYDLKIDSLNQELRDLRAQIEIPEVQAQNNLELSNSRKFRDSGLFIDMKPPLRSYSSQVSNHSGHTPNINGSGSTIGQQLTWQEGFSRSRNNSVHERSERHIERYNSYERNTHEDTSFDSPSMMEEIYPSEAADAGDFGMGMPANAGATKNIQIISKMSSTVRRLETEIMTLKEENAQLAEQKNSAQREIIDRSELLEKINALEAQLAAVKGELAEKEHNEETLLEVIGEKSERVEELKADVADLKDLLRSQVQQMIEMQENK